PKVELPRQQVNTPPPPPRQQVKSSPINPAELEAKFKAWEFEQEIAEIKANIKSPGANQKAQTPPKTPRKTTSQKDKVANAYRVLGLEPNVSFTEVKQAYKTLVKKWHPDLFVNQPQMQKQVQEKMRLVNEAYNILNDHYS
ncbi:MAG: J domain-containing protein, partial [Cuspidothrix sp.]